MEKSVKGYRTIFTMVLGLVFSLMSAQGWVIPESDQAAIMTGSLAIAGIIRRLQTSSPVFTGDKEENANEKS